MAYLLTPMTQSRALTEFAIRSALLARLQAHAPKTDLLIEELGIEHGAARVDVAVASDRLLGYEIKSDLDTLDRLAQQMHAYHRVFDALTIVTTVSFLDQVEALLPKWWGIMLAEPGNGSAVRLTEHRPANSHQRQDALSIAALLWRDEAYAFVLEQLGAVIKSRATRAELYELIAAEIPLPRIRDRVLATLRTRVTVQRRLYVAGEQLTDGVDEMVVGRIAAPRRQIA